MLAYVFWHWPRPAVGAREYEALQRAFHAALAAAPSDGFHRSRSAAIAGATWANGGGPAYEDWYLVRGSAALDPLEAAAISASRQGPHDAAAAAAGGGTAGLYRLRLGEPVAGPSEARWFAKPPGMTYPALWDALRPAVERHRGALWGRQMVLGPTPEFCLHSVGPIELPAGFAPILLRLTETWPAAPR
ncbi:MAG TPA: hypothetical protein VNA89_16410 [Gemmatimonadaceae bacterium]|nr:hypothetical protein [Gemmatimonadaceae bacterium]